MWRRANLNERVSCSFAIASILPLSSVQADIVPPSRPRCLCPIMTFFLHFYLYEDYRGRYVDRLPVRINSSTSSTSLMTSHSPFRLSFSDLFRLFLLSLCDIPLYPTRTAYCYLSSINRSSFSFPFCLLLRSSHPFSPSCCLQPRNPTPTAARLLHVTHSTLWYNMLRFLLSASY